MTDAESLRGVALLAESRLSGETLGRIVADHRRLFVGTAQRGPVACAKAPATAAPSFARLRGDLVRAGALEPSVAAADLGDGLSALAVLLAVDTEVTRRLREALLGEHLLAWGASCLSRVQLGAQTFLYQGVATLGLGLLRHAGDGDHPGDALGSGE
ncbi:MAG TPA: hypothetical protein VKZ83_14400 [Phototrophicaceae bacterium]|nr:hypothetical protein [Phototrophicaceae bacterium]